MLLTKTDNTRSSAPFFIWSLVLEPFQEVWRDLACFYLVSRGDAIVLFVFLLIENC